MKLWILSALSIALAAVSLAQPQSKQVCMTQTEDLFYYLPQLSQEEIQQFLINPSPSSILVCPQGTSFSLNFFLKGDLFEIESSDSPLLYTLNIKQTFYLRFQDEQVLISLDGIIWKSWQEMLTGTLSLELAAHNNQLQLGAEIYLRR